MANEPISMYRKLLGYMDADRRKPIYAAMPGALVTHAFILCCKCKEAISSNMGPRQNAWCVSCTDQNEKDVIEQEKEDKLEKDRADALAKRIAKEKEDADNTEKDKLDDRWKD